MTQPTNTPTILIVLGATGDLMQRKIVPALHHLHQEGKLPNLFQVVGFARRPLSDDEFRTQISQALAEHKAIESTDEQFLNRFRYHQGDFTTPDGYNKLAELLGRIDGSWQACANKLFYLAVPPDLYQTIFENLSSSGLTEPCSNEEGWTRVIVEKPFGQNLQSARDLDEHLNQLFKEEQIYRIDHYLAKEMVQNILTLRFSNNLFEDSWHNKSIEKIEIRLLEKLGVGNRADSFDSLGALRDVGQNHLLQMLALCLMENPGRFDAESIRMYRRQALEHLPQLTEEEITKQTVRAQFTGYQELEGVQPDSFTETYFRIKTMVHTPRWEGVPLTIESGKSLSETRKEIVVTFKHPEPCLCPPGTEVHQQNSITISLEPTEAITAKFWLKKPGLDFALEQRQFDFLLHDADNTDPRTGGYEKLLFDCINGDQTLFVSTDEIKAMWHFIDPIREAWDHGVTPLLNYQPGSDPATMIQE